MSHSAFGETHTALTRGLRLFSRVMLVTLCILSLLPLYWMLVGSFRIQTDNMRLPPEWLPMNPTLDNYSRVFRQGAPRWFLNSVIVSSGGTLLAVMTSTMAGYSIGKKEFVGRKLLFAAVIATMMLPRQVFLVPLFVLVRQLHLGNTHIGMMIPHIAYPLGIFLMKQFMQNIPQDLIDAGRVDGASEWSIYWKIILPIAKPVVGALAIFAFTMIWKDYLWQLIVGSTERMLTLPIGVGRMATQREYTNYGLLMAGATFNFIPMLILFARFQDYFIKGVTAGAVKG